MQWNWQTGGQNAYDAAQNALNQNRQKMYNQNMDERQVGNGLDMMSWMQQGNDAAQYQAQQEQAAAQQAQAEEAQRAEQINLIKSQIAELQKSIADKQMRLQNFDDGVNEIAAIEARKINSQDPTMIWRWQKQREDTAKANAMNDKITSNKFNNEAEALLKTEMPETYAEQVQQLKNVRMKIAEGKTIGADTSALEAQEKVLSENVEATHKNDQAVKSAKSKMNELKRQLAMKAITPTQYRDGIRSLIGTFDNDELNDQLYTEFLGGNKAIQNKNKADENQDLRKKMGLF